MRLVQIRQGYEASRSRSPSSLRSRQNKAKVARAVSSPHGDERNPCLKLRQGPLFERRAQYRESGVDSP
jgi:hypothetical protein